MRTLFILVCLVSVVKIHAQDRILLRNPSFEGAPGAGVDIPGWYNCGPMTETPPDIQPGFFKCTMDAIEGKTYLGMSARETGTWESVGEKLSAPLQFGENYTFSLWLARSENYLSGARGYREPKNFTEPLRLRIWAGEGYCDRGELLAQTTTIENTDWMLFDFTFSPKEYGWTHIILEAYYDESAEIEQLYTNGNLLIDDCSAIIKIEK